MKQSIFIFAIVVVALVVVQGKLASSQTLGGGGIGPATRACTVASTTVATLGHQFTSRVMATSSLRAFAIIQIPDNATNTVRLNFGQDAGATASNGIVLNGANLTGASTTQSSFTFGLATDFPYVGSVQALSDNGSTTVNITNCNYPQ